MKWKDKKKQEIVWVGLPQKGQAKWVRHLPPSPPTDQPSMGTSSLGLNLYIPSLSNKQHVIVFTHMVQHWSITDAPLLWNPLGAHLYTKTVLCHVNKLIWCPDNIRKYWDGWGWNQTSFQVKNHSHHGGLGGNSKLDLLKKNLLHLFLYYTGLKYFFLKKYLLWALTCWIGFVIPVQICHLIVYI